MTYTFYLTRWPNRNTKVVIPAESSVKAHETIKEDYPGWSVSMFWPNWEPTKKIAAFWHPSMRVVPMPVTLG